MEKSELISVLTKIRYSLEGVSVQGKSNCGKIYGCLDILEKVLSDLCTGDTPEQEQE